MLRTMAAAAATALAVGTALPMVAHAADVSEDEDAYIQVSPVKGQSAGWGTAWANQVVSEDAGVQTGNTMTGWMTVYGLAAKTRYQFTVVPGKCGTDRDAVSSTRTIKTDSRGGWHGKYNLTIRKPTKWVVRGGYRLDIRKKNGGVKACGAIKDDPDIGN